MSWIDRLNNVVFTIITGDGKVFTPLWKNGETSKEFNTSINNFINVEGSKIDRRKVKARKFPLTFWFTGDNNIEQADAFDLSANDNRAWTVKHPFYGDIIGQPLSIARNDTFYNSTEITVDFWETITDEYPKQSIAIVETLMAKFVTLSSTSGIDYASKVELAPIDINIVKENSRKISLNIEKLLDNSNYSEFQLAKNNMFAKIDKIILAPADAIQSMYEIIGLPASFALSVGIRINLFKAIFNDALSVMQIKPNRNNKAYFESIGAAVLGSMANALVTPLQTDFISRTDVGNATTQMVDLFNQYKVLLDNASVQINDTNNTFIPSASTQRDLQSIIIIAINKLNEIAFGAKQERITILERDSNLIVLTHRFMGLDSEDKNIDTFRKINNIINKRLFQIKKGTPIRYYA